MPLKKITLSDGTTQEINTDLLTPEDQYLLALDQFKSSVNVASQATPAGRPPRLQMEEQLTPSNIPFVGFTAAPGVPATQTNIDRPMERFMGGVTGAASGALTGSAANTAVGAVSGMFNPPRDVGDVAENALGSAALGKYSPITKHLEKMSPFVRPVAGAAAGGLGAVLEKKFGNLFRAQPEDVNRASVALGTAIPLLGGLPEFMLSRSRQARARELTGQALQPTETVKGTSFNQETYHPKNEIGPAQTETQRYLKAEVADPLQNETVGKVNALAKNEETKLLTNAKILEHRQGYDAVKEVGRNRAAKEVIAIDEDITKLKRQMEREANESKYQRAAQLLDLDEKISVAKKSGQATQLEGLESERRRLKAKIDPLNPLQQQIDQLEQQKKFLQLPSGDPTTRKALIAYRNNERVAKRRQKELAIEKNTLTNELDRIRAHYSGVEAAIHPAVKELANSPTPEKAIELLFGKGHESAGYLAYLMGNDSPLRGAAKTSLQRAGVQKWYQDIVANPDARLGEHWDNEKLAALFGPANVKEATNIMNDLGIIRNNPIIHYAVNKAPFAAITALGSNLYFPHPASTAIGSASAGLLAAVQIDKFMEWALKDPKHGAQLHRWATQGKASVGSLKYFPALNDFLKNESLPIETTTN